ncbi:hypothetical protein Emag_001320 [Eimeria magna]
MQHRRCGLKGLAVVGQLQQQQPKRTHALRYCSSNSSCSSSKNSSSNSKRSSRGIKRESRMDTRCSNSSNSNSTEYTSSSSSSKKSSSSSKNNNSSSSSNLTLEPSTTATTECFPSSLNLRTNPRAFDHK